MDPDPSSSLLIIGIALLASAFFSGMEIAFVSANRLQIELDSKTSWQGRILSHLAGRTQLFIATMLVGNNLALVFCGLESGALISEGIFHVGDWTEATQPLLVLGTQTLITTVVILVLAEFTPKALFHTNANFWLKFFCRSSAGRSLRTNSPWIRGGGPQPIFNPPHGPICRLGPT